ncbi:MAG: type II toxin-antitoxin system VapC family toxin [Armatimonadetes bacterium]|nr:type II toxin-antitoxin system VapC family toxin [Armatimonadota bacterium]
MGVKLVLTEPYSELAAGIVSLPLQHPDMRLVVPDLFDLECANVLWKRAKRGDLPTASVLPSLQAISDLALKRVPVGTLLRDATAFALTTGITVYDACYAALAVAEGLPLVSADERLVQVLAGSACQAIWLANWPRTP